jgi:hypothetical protein
VFCDDGSSICHVDSKGWARPKCVAGAYRPRRFGIDGHHAGSSGDAIKVHRRGAAAELGPVHAEQIAQDPQQWHVRRRVDGVGLTVNFQCDHDRPPHASPKVVDIDPSDVEQNLSNGSVVRHSKVRVSMTAICALNGSDILSAATR